MQRNDGDPRLRQRLIGIFLAGLALFNFPLLGAVGERLSQTAVPDLYLYLFVVWALLIVLMGLVARRT